MAKDDKVVGIYTLWHVNEIYCRMLEEQADDIFDDADQYWHIDDIRQLLVDWDDNRERQRIRQAYNRMKEEMYG